MKSEDLTASEIEAELRRDRNTIREIWERSVSMKATHPSQEGLIESVFQEIRAEIVGPEFAELNGR